MFVMWVSRVWAWEPAEPVVTPVGPVTAAVVVPGAAVATGPTGTFVIRGDQSVRVGGPARDLAVGDVDGEGRLDVLVCGTSGVSWWRDGAEATVSLLTDECGALEVEAGAVVLVGPRGLERRTLAGGSLGLAQPISTLLAPDALLAVLDGRVAVASRGKQEVTEFSDRGVSVFDAGGRVGALAAWNDRFAWTLDDLAVIADPSGRHVPIAPGPGASVVADLDGDGRSEWLVAHGVDRLGIVDASGERIVAVPGSIRALAAGDLDGDRCSDVVVGTDAGLAIVAGRCGNVVAAVRVDEVEPVASDAVPPPMGADGSLVGAVVLGATTRLDVFVGQTLDVELLGADSGLMYAARGGPEGLLVYPDGRLIYTATADRVGTWPIAVKMWHRGSAWTVEQLTLHVHPLPDGVARPAIAVVSRPPPPMYSPGAIPLNIRVRFDLCTAMAGVSAGGTYAATWETVGNNSFLPSASPALAITCEIGGSGVRFFGGIDSAVAFQYVIAENVLGAHVLAASGGFLYGGDKFRIGPIGTMGTLVLGAGARALWLPYGQEPGKRPRGFEARVLALGPALGDLPAVEVMLMYGIALREFR